MRDPRVLIGPAMLVFVPLSQAVPRDWCGTQTPLRDPTAAALPVEPRLAARALAEGDARSAAALTCAVGSCQTRSGSG